MRRTGCHAAAGDQHEAEPPADLEPVARLVGAVGGADEVERVGEPERGDAAREQDPGAVELPARAGERADDQAEQQQVGDRVGEADRDLHRLAGGAVAHGLEDERGAGGRDGERGGDAVGPERAGHVAGAAAQEHQHADEHQRREEQVAAVGGRGDRDLLRGPQDGGVVDLAEGPRGRRRRRSRARRGARGGRARRCRPRGTWRRRRRARGRGRSARRAGRRRGRARAGRGAPRPAARPPWRPR